MTVLTSTGNVSVTSSTNWSPAQIPTSADDLVLADGHTLTVDADATILSLTVNDSPTSRLTPSGAVRTLTVTNGITYLGRAGTNAVDYFCVVVGTEFTLNASHDFGAVAGKNAFVFDVSSGGTLALNAAALTDHVMTWARASSAFYFFRCDSSAVDIVGRVAVTDMGNNGNRLFQCLNGSDVSFTHTGLSSVIMQSANQVAIYGEGGAAGTISLSGDWDFPMPYTYNGFSGFIYLNGVINLTINGDIDQSVATPNVTGAGVIRVANAAAVVNMNGSITQSLGCGTAAVFMTTGIFNWVSQTAVVPAGRQLFFYQSGGNFVMTDLTIENSGVTLVNAYNAIVTNSGIVNMTSTAGGVSFPTTMSITNAESEAPVLPDEEDVASGTVYGYSGIDKTGTGLIVDPAILTAALSASLASYSSPPTGGPVERSPNDTNPITFSWPVSGATITAEVSINNAAYGATTGVVSFLRTEGSLHYYSLAFNAADRPTAEGTSRYKLVDGTYTQYVTLRVDGISAELLANARIAAQNTQS